MEPPSETWALVSKRCNHVPVPSRSLEASCRGLSSCVFGVPLAYEELVNLPASRGSTPVTGNMDVHVRPESGRMLISQFLNSWIENSGNEHLASADDIEPFNMNVFEVASEIRFNDFTPMSTLQLQSQCPSEISNYMIHTMGMNPLSHIIIVNRDVIRSFSMRIPSAFLTRARDNTLCVGIGGSFIRLIIEELGLMGTHVRGHVDDVKPFVFSRSRMGPFFHKSVTYAGDTYTSIWATLVCVPRVDEWTHSNMTQRYSLQIWCHSIAKPNTPHKHPTDVGHVTDHGSA